ncbi:hypothetical protein BDK51DRAFT_43336 [Blyttiomyces helicus]|uniref:Uncharacterized protein n=1 Tax=Blyttiomyces helicus TaxID=388810 RepID=A0A4P9WHS6_9FUNG|nr:hypothetical protein BDK51DRAFT_43336 [Blyttiomyces helicus]|eukprot:RKO92391.1 hypothetical protein BDK51DRAFT_43336 [Blyttiomyces helicus]
MSNSQLARAHSTSEIDSGVASHSSIRPIRSGSDEDRPRTGELDEGGVSDPLLDMKTIATAQGSLLQRVSNVSFVALLGQRIAMAAKHTNSPSLAIPVTRQTKLGPAAEGASADRRPPEPASSISQVLCLWLKSRKLEDNRVPCLRGPPWEPGPDLHNSRREGGAWGGTSREEPSRLQVTIGACMIGELILEVHKRFQIAGEAGAVVFILIACQHAASPPATPLSPALRTLLESAVHDVHDSDASRYRCAEVYVADAFLGESTHIVAFRTQVANAFRSPPPALFSEDNFLLWGTPRFSPPRTKQKGPMGSAAPRTSPDISEVSITSFPIVAALFAGPDSKQTSFWFACRGEMALPVPEGP